MRWRTSHLRTLIFICDIKFSMCYLGEEIMCFYLSKEIMCYWYDKETSYRDSHNEYS